MFKTPLILGLLILCACYGRVNASPCPLPNHPGNVHSGQIIAALNTGSVPLLEGIDTQCYNYSLPYEFQSVPEVAIAVHDFEFQQSNTVSFFIKTLHTDSVSTVPFVIRTYWSYTKWTQISFSFIAEDRHDLQSGYYQIDSGSLSGCQNGKQIEILMPFRNEYNNHAIKHFLFLHGFQITTVAYSQARSPYEIQIVASSANITGITVALSVTSTTQVDSIYISFIAYQLTTLDLITGSYTFDRTSSNSIAHTPSVSVPRSYARIYGITGFIINYVSYSISFSTRWDGFSFNYEFASNTNKVQYLSNTYIFFINSECKDCPGYPIAFNNSCSSSCPQGTFIAPDNTCRDCGKGKIWNGTQCIISCPTGQYLNVAKNICECPPSLNWNGQSCIPCTSGKVFVPQTLSCECPAPFRWNGFACAQVGDCKNGKQWSTYSYSCECPETTFWNGTYCQNIVICTGGRVHDMNYNCICPDNYYWNVDRCIYSPCIGGQVWQGTQCVCPAGKNFNGKMCVECINGQVWNQLKKQCVCEDGYKWNTQYCERTYDCTGNRVWNTTYEQCICREQYYWSGFACLPIPNCLGGQYWNSVLMKCVCSTTTQWNGTRCVFCYNGQIWDPATLKCVCPPGTYIINGQCQYEQQCTGGKMWMQNARDCQCPEGTLWNGNYCISNACGNGRTYDPKFQSCVCPDNKVWMNERCVPPQISCNNGRVWNSAIYACQCPKGTYPNFNKCDPIKICTNGTTYNPLTNDCTCPYGQALINFKCANPNCPPGQYYNGYQCEVISCPPPSYFYENKCVYGGPNQCTYGYQWNGQTCVLYPPTCPLGTQWSNSNCQSVGSCQNGFYLSSSGSCESFPQKCTPPATWSGDKCGVSGSQCPSSTFFSNGKCQPYTPCQNGHVWDFVYLRCICPSGYISNGVSCVECGNGKSWDPKLGCVCPEGSFDTGISCESVVDNRCKSIPNTFWQNNKCLCRPGFTKIGFQCICYGTQIGDLCDKCSYKPNSKWVSSTNICECVDGYTDVRGNCIKDTIAKGNDDPSKCNVGTYFDGNQRMCLPCPDGCLSCFDCYRCRSCRPEFIYNPSNEQCIEKCGDGKKFILECDDGNNKDGDGCSRDCKIENGFTCTGGSPQNKDSCYLFRPDRITISQTGQIRKSSSIVLNVKLNYLPSSLMLSGDCANNCKQVLQTTIIEGDRSAVSINSEFVLGTKYSFIVTIDFGRSYIGAFKASISVSQDLVPKYFGAIPTDTLLVDVKPNYLASINENDILY